MILKQLRKLTAVFFQAVPLLDYPPTMDMSYYLDPSVRGNKERIYYLQTVVVRFGPTGEHRCVYVRPSSDAQWLKVRDLKVSYTGKTEMLETSTSATSMMGSAGGCFATMLVYVEREEREPIGSPGGYI